MLGAQQQATEQAKLNYPMEAQKNLAGIIGGLQIPTGVTQTATGPAGKGQMGPSPLSQIASLGTSAGNFLSYPGASLGLKDKDGKPFTGSLGAYLTGLFKDETKTGIPVSPAGLGNPVDGTGPNGTAGTGQLLGTDGKVYNDETYGKDKIYPPIEPDAPLDTTDMTQGQINEINNGIV
jgi:hypothetical protein